MFFWVLLFPVFLCLLVLLLFDVQLVVCVVGFYLIGDLWFGVCCLALVALFVCVYVACWVWGYVRLEFVDWFDGVNCRFGIWMLMCFGCGLWDCVYCALVLGCLFVVVDVAFGFNSVAVIILLLLCLLLLVYCCVLGCRGCCGIGFLWYLFGLVVCALIAVADCVVCVVVICWLCC